jgi:hypothetical protein
VKLRVACLHRLQAYVDKDLRVLNHFRLLLGRTDESDRKLLLSMAGKMAAQTKRRKKAG